MRKLFFILLFPIAATTAQQINDTIVISQPVEITASEIFRKEIAGMKSTRIDTAVILNKINLSLSELLSQNTPVFIKNYGRGALATASFRGTGSSHTQVNWNGISINSPMAGMVDFSLIPVSIIDNLSLDYGPSAVMLPNGGIGGAVRMYNSVDWTNRIKAKYIQGIGSYKTYDELLHIDLGSDKIQSKTRVYHNYSKNDFTFINRAIGNIDPASGEIVHPIDTNCLGEYKRYGILQEIYYKINPGSVLSVRWWGQKAERNIPTVSSYEGPENSNRSVQTDDDNHVVLNYSKYGVNNKLEIIGGFSHKKLHYTTTNSVTGLGDIQTTASGSYQKSYLLKSNYSIDFRKDFSLNAFAEFNRHHINSFDTIQMSGYKGKRNDISIYMALRKSFFERLNINLVLKQNIYTETGGAFVPFLGVDFKLLKNQDLVLKGNIARNYHQPSLNDLYWQPGGNPDLLPEEGMSYEIGTEYLLAKNSITFKTGLTAYYSDIENWIVWLPGFKGYWEPINSKHVIAKGLEYFLQMETKWNQITLKLIGNYSYTSSKNFGDPVNWGDDSFGKQLPYVPLHSGNIFTHISYRGFFITYQHNTYSERFTTTSNDITLRGSIYPYYMNDASIGKEFDLNQLFIATELRIQNLFNETYYSDLFRPMPGRNYMLQLMIKFDK